MKLTIKRGLNPIIYNNYFTCDCKYYKQNHEAPMGSTILGLLAKYTFRHIVEHLTQICWYFYNLTVQYREI